MEETEYIKSRLTRLEKYAINFSFYPTLFSFLVLTIYTIWGSTHYNEFYIGTGITAELITAFLLSLFQTISFKTWGARRIEEYKTEYYNKNK